MGCGRNDEITKPKERTGRGRHDQNHQNKGKNRARSQ